MELHTTVGLSISEYIDYSIHWAGGGPNIARYKIRAKDVQNKLSVFSDSGQVSYGNVWKGGGGDGEVLEVPTSFRLDQNFPNPFNPSTTIHYALPIDAYVVLRVYNTLGQEIATLVEGEQKAGWYQATFDATLLSNGIYAYRLHAGDFVESRKMLLLK